MSKKAFNLRGFVSLFMVLSIIAEFVSGVILYLAPPGRVAHWTEWKLLFLTKEGWQAVHTVFGFFMVIAVILHLYYNWKVFTSYIIKKAKKALNLKVEIALSLLLALVLWLGSVYHVPPVSYVMDLGEYATDSWESKKDRAPVPHAEEYSLVKISETVNVPLDRVQEKLKKAGVTFRGPEETLAEIARKNNTSPNALYEIIVEGEEVKELPVEGSGYGKKTLGEVASEMNIPLEKVLERLEKAGIRAEGKQKLRDIASSNDIEPVELLSLISGGD
jgi:predicted DNA-binding protein YlxM (UPF0122 family)